MHRILKEELNFIPRDMKTELCKCNNCESILYDQNPQINAPTYFAPKGTENMELIENEFWGCPICKTDDYLTDL